MTSGFELILSFWLLSNCVWPRMLHSSRSSLFLRGELLAHHDVAGGRSQNYVVATPEVPRPVLHVRPSLSAGIPAPAASPETEICSWPFPAPAAAPSPRFRQPRLARTRRPQKRQVPYRTPRRIQPCAKYPGTGPPPPAPLHPAPHLASQPRLKILGFIAPLLRIQLSTKSRHSSEFPLPRSIPSVRGISAA